MKKFIITEEEKSSIRRMYLLEQDNTITGNFNVIPKSDWGSGSGFFAIRINPDDSITSVINKWDGGQQESQKNSLTPQEPKENNTIGATYWFKGVPNQTFTININGTSGSGTLKCTVKDAEWNGYSFYFTNLSIGTYTITTSISSTDSLTVTVSQPVNCDTEWKTLYELMEKNADEGSIDLRPYYCSNSRSFKSQDDYIKQNFPNIEQSKIDCLNKKIKNQYC